MHIFSFDLRDHRLHHRTCELYRSPGPRTTNPFVCGTSISLDEAWMTPRFKNEPKIDREGQSGPGCAWRGLLFVQQELGKQ